MVMGLGMLGVSLVMGPVVVGLKVGGRLHQPIALLEGVGPGPESGWLTAGPP